MKTIYSKVTGLMLVLLFAASTISFSQEKPIKPPIFQLPISDFTLPVYQGGR